ncbi:MAG: segregation/condensation protein A [Finegoldia sp.]|nr:segregation/condensation protein A [Finegoldia sp.]
MINVVTDEFNGPMDLLLSLVEKEKVDIEQISLSEITNKYLIELDKMKEDNPDELSDFIYLASTLLLIKSKKILPVNEYVEDDEISEEEMKERIKEYKRFKDLSIKLKKLEEESLKHHHKLQEDISKYFSHEQYLIESDVNLLFESVRDLLKRLENRIDVDNSEILEVDNYKVEDCMEEIEFNMKEERLYEFSEFISQKPSKVEIISKFLAILELIKLGHIRTRREDQVYLRPVYE